MRILTDIECSDWLDSRNIVENPYSSNGAQPPYAEQLSLAYKGACVSALFCAIVDSNEECKNALLHVTDWNGYRPDAMAVFTQVRRAFGEHRPMIEAPGHLFGPDERDLLSGLCSLVTNSGWTAYLYFDNGITLLSWEGDLLDFFTSDPQHHEAMCALFREFGISSTAK